jgi:hypothetical protein
MGVGEMLRLYPARNERYPSSPLSPLTTRERERDSTPRVPVTAPVQDPGGRRRINLDAD